MPADDPGSPQPSAPHSHRHRQPSSTRRRVLWTLAAAVVLVLLAGAWVGLRAYQAKDHLDEAVKLVSTLERQVTAVDTDGAQATLAKLKDESGAARSAAGDPIWSVAQHLPWIGDDLRAVRTVATAVDDVTTQTVDPLVTAAAALDPAHLAPKDGVIDVAELQRAAPQITDADRALRQVRARMQKVDTNGLTSQVADAVTEFRGKLDHAATLTHAASEIGQLLPPMLGADGTRTYLLAFQNSAELRATGGIFGAYAVVTADHGRITLKRFGSTSTEMPKFDPPVATLPEDLRRMFGQHPARWPTDVNMIPNYPDAAKLFRTMYQTKFGGHIDGVIATDPVALSYILKATGPVDLGDGPAAAAGVTQLTAANAVPFLLSKAYAVGTPDNADAIFAQSAEAVFRALTSGQGDGAALIRQLVEATGQHRVLVWSAHKSEQSVLGGAAIGGTLPTKDGSTPTVGVFLNDATGAKLDYYVKQSVAVKSPECTPDGRLALSAAVTLSSDAPSSGLPDYVTGMALAGKGIVRTNVFLMTPTNGDIVSVTKDGEKARFQRYPAFGRWFVGVTVDLPPGKSSTVTLTMTSGKLAGPASSIDVRTTPMAHDSTVTVGKPASCGAS